MKGKKILKHVMFFMLMACIVLGSHAAAQAAAKTPKYAISLNKSVYTLKKGKTVKLKAAFNKAARKKQIVWSSSNQKVAAVSKNGKVTAKKNGKVKITAKLKGTKVKAVCTIHVGAPVKSIQLGQSAVSLKTGGNFQLNPTIKPKKAVVKKVTYQSSNSNVASVSKKGVIWAVAAGTAKITVTAADGSGKRAVCTVTVEDQGPDNDVERPSEDTSTPPENNIEILVESVTLDLEQLNLKPEEEAQLMATVFPANAANQTIRWESANLGVAEVSENGLVKAVAAGTTVITAAASNGVHAECVVTVEAADIGETPKEPDAEPEEPDITPEEPDTEPDITPEEPDTEPEEPDITPEEPDTEPENGKLLVAYFSWSGTSERIAQNIIEQTGADAFRIERETPYSTDYTETAYGDAKTEAEQNARPPIKDPLDSVEQYSKIILCYPIWWHTAPMTVGTFLERYDLSGKQIYPISQSASMDRSQYEQSVTFVQECAKGAIVDAGLFTKDNAAIREYVEHTIL